MVEFTKPQTGSMTPPATLPVGVMHPVSVDVLRGLMTVRTVSTAPRPAPLASKELSYCSWAPALANGAANAPARVSPARRRFVAFIGEFGRGGGGRFRSRSGGGIAWRPRGNRHAEMPADS